MAYSKNDEFDYENKLKEFDSWFVSTTIEKKFTYTNKERFYTNRFLMFVKERYKDVFD